MVSVPKGLKRIVQALALSLPLAAIEVVLVKKAPWWRLPYQQVGMALIPVLALYFALSLVLLKGKRIGFYAVAACGALWFLSSGWMALRLHNPNVGMFALFLGGLFSACLAWLHVELGRSFLDPRMHWYEGLPRPIPGLHCEVHSEAEREAFRVTRLDREGVFVFRDNARANEKTLNISTAGKRDLLLSFRDRQVRCTGVPVRIADRMGPESGIGFQFRDLSPDARKSLGDFVEALKGEGYVS